MNAVLVAGFFLALSGGAAESNSICYDGETSTDEYSNPVPAYLTNGTLTVQLNWESSLVPQGSTRALLNVGSAARDVSQRLYPRQFAEVTKPATSVSFTLFDSETPPRDDDIRISLTFVSEDGTRTNAEYATFCQLSRGSFGQARVLSHAGANGYDTQKRVYRIGYKYPLHAKTPTGSELNHRGLRLCLTLDN